MTDSAYRRKHEPLWWAKHPWHRRYMLREMSSVFIAAYMFNLLNGLRHLALGEGKWLEWLALQQTAPMRLFGLLTLAMVCYHMVTWFLIAPKAMPGQIGKFQLPALWITAAHFLASAVLTVLLLTLVWRG